MAGFACMGPLMAQDPIPGGCLVIGPNLVENPEFDLGDTLFLSSYQYHPDYACAFGDYTIAPSVVHDPVGGAACYNGTGFDLTTIWAASDRNQPGAGNFMMVDPTDTAGANFIIWQQTIDVCPGSEYVFSAFAKNLYYLEATFPYSNIDPVFDLTINGVAVFPYYIDGNLAPPTGEFQPLLRQSIVDSTIWTQVSGRWLSGSSTTATITIKNTVPGTQGNDIAIDGVFFGLCARAIDISPNVSIGQCEQLNTVQPVTFTVPSQTIASGWLFYEWYKNGNLIQADPNPVSFITPADVNGEYFGNYQLRVYEDPLGSAGAGCSFVSNDISIFEDCPVSFPVEWLGLDVEAQGQRGVLNWSTAWESQNQGFDVQMAAQGEAFRSIGFVKGAGNAQEPTSYQFLTEPLMPGRYQFRLRQIDVDGRASMSRVLELQIEGPQGFELTLRPNPANQVVTVDMVSEFSQPVRAELISADGRIIATWRSGAESRNHQWNLTLTDLPEGLYLVRVRGGSQTTAPLLVIH